MKEAYDEIKKRFLEYSKKDDDDALKILLEQLNYYKLKFENFINNKLNCVNDKELFKKLVEILKQKIKVESHLYNLMEDRNRIISKNQVLKNLDFWVCDQIGLKNCRLDNFSVQFTSAFYKQALERAKAFFTL
ncbi:uncharacterized protein LOC111621917 [Centruroides sculpturatus]|uniref:uncharacterized protein LOC111621917 n=1 Tax=Centruroides sculpturatus TaxID=218467 RepID=UPI000C6D3476|nr:uncharacterized protein LOC111621917 [Centruroides sculpturatus]